MFPSGATISFDHYEDDRADDNYQGIEISNAMYDEAAHAKERHIWWLISRLRRRDTSNNSIWLTCNPDPDSWLFPYVSWWLYPEGHPDHGLPDPEKNGAVRWLLRKEGLVFWGDSREEMILKYGKPELPIDHPKQVKPLSFQVILGTIYDNPWLIDNQPEYLASLEALPDVERRRLLLGDWTAREEANSYFSRTWCPEDIVHPPASDIIATVRCYDLAGTLKSKDSGNEPDYTASAKVSKLKSGGYFVHDVQRTRIRFGDWERFILENAATDGKNTKIVIPEDPNPAAKSAAAQLTQKISEHGYIVTTMRSTKSKLDRFRPFSSLAQNGHIKFLKNCGIDYENNIFNDNNFVYKELEAFTGLRRSGQNGHDDMVDALSDCIEALVNVKQIPNFSSNLASTSFTTSNQFF